MADETITPGVPERAGARKAKKATAAEPEAPARVVSIHAHPDDQEFTVAGTLAKWARAGSHVVSVCITRGGAGSNDATPADMTREALERIRETEQQAACNALGVAELIFLDYPDGMLEATMALRRDLTRLIRRIKPDAVVCGDPTVRYYGNMYMNHPDHRAAADAVLDAVFPSSETRLIFPELLDEGLPPHKVKAVWIHGSDKPDTFVDISGTLDVKVAALREHKSQMGPWDPTEMITLWAREQGQPRKLAAAEAYRRMVIGGP